jgi:hypothetical protein
MNERIKELMKQAGTDSSGKWMGVEHAEKFAELIVRECAKVADNGWADPGHQIKQHFGVEL